MFRQQCRFGLVALRASDVTIEPDLDLRATLEAHFGRLTSKVLALVDQGRSYRLIGREVGLSKNTVADIVKRHRDKATQIA